MLGRTNAAVINGTTDFGYTVDFISDGANYVRYLVTDGQSVPQPSPPAPTGTEQFLCWTSGDTKITFPYKPTGNVTLTAIFGTPVLLVPVMTSNNTPSGLCYASSQHPSFSVYNAFRRLLTPSDAGQNVGVETLCVWALGETVNNAYVAYDFGSAKHITNVGFYPSYYRTERNEYMTVKVQGSNDNANWTDISAENTILCTGYATIGAYVSYRDISCDPSSAYRYIRIKPTYFCGKVDIHDGSNSSAYVAQIDIYGMGEI